MLSTGRKTQRGKTTRPPPSSGTGSRSCGTVNLLTVFHSQPIGSIRYLSKLCDQLFCLLSKEHSKAIAWGEDDDGEDTEGEEDDSDGASTDSEKAETNRFYHFEVAKTKDQEENVVVREGFLVR